MKKVIRQFYSSEKGDIIIHSSKKKLRITQPELDKVEYPFLLSAVEEGNEYLACKITMYFAHDKNITKLIEKMHKAIS